MNVYCQCGEKLNNVVTVMESTFEWEDAGVQSYSSISDFGL